MARTPKVVEDRREQIIDAAMNVFAQKGFVRATNKDIAREAGITPGLIYHYFESKEALLQAIVESRTPLKIIRSLPLAFLDQPPEAVLRMAMKQVLAIIESENYVQFVRLFLPELLHNPTIAPFGITAAQQALEFLGGYFALKMESGELRKTDPQIAAQLLISSMISFFVRRQILRDPQALAYSHEQIVDYVVTFALQGLLPH